MATPEVSDFYAGSRLLLPLSSATGLPLDQINFLICQLVALLLGFPFRIFLGPRQASVVSRHCCEIVVGLILLLFCFSYQTWHVLIQSTLCYVLMHKIKGKAMAKIVFGTSMLYLSVMHIYRQIYDNGGYCLDITGPLMISTQRLSSLAYSVSDGRVLDKDKLTANQKIHAVRKFPSLLEFFSYIFSFHGVVLGPFGFYNDYIYFIEGKSLTPAEEVKQHGQLVDNDVNKEAVQTPSPLGAVGIKLLCCLLNGVIMIAILPWFHIETVWEPEFQERSLFKKMTFIVLISTITRSKYYFAWFLGEAVNNNAGFGVSRHNKDGGAEWGLITNADLKKVEISTSLKVVLDGWNQTTTYWLRHVVYERIKFQSTIAVFLTSAIWHGFYPGYYFTFLTGAAFILVGRKFRRTIRPKFQSSKQLAFLYDAITFSATRLVLAYTTVPFLTLSLAKTIYIYRITYFCLFVGGVISYFAVPGGKPRSAESKPSEKPENNESKPKDQ